LSTKSQIKYPVILLFGPTGVGKTDLIYSVFRDNFEIINADSMQVYRGMDIGSAKPEPEVLSSVPHHLIDILDPDVQFNAGKFVSMADSLVREITERGRIPVLSGGTAFYFRNFLTGLPGVPVSDSAVRSELERELEVKGSDFLYRELERVDPLRAEKISRRDTFRIIRALEVYRVSGNPPSSYEVPSKIRPHLNPLILGLDRPRAELYRRIDMRVDVMFSRGLPDEVKTLIERGYGREDPGMKGIGYREFFLQADIGELTVSGVSDLIKRNSRRYAKRQLTFFRKIPGVRWFSPGDPAVESEIGHYLKNV